MAAGSSQEAAVHEKEAEEEQSEVESDSEEEKEENKEEEAGLEHRNAAAAESAKVAIMNALEDVAPAQQVGLFSWTRCWYVRVRCRPPSPDACLQSSQLNEPPSLGACCLPNSVLLLFVILQDIEQEVGQLSYRQLQKLCKYLRLPATKKTAELQGSLLAEQHKLLELRTRLEQVELLQAAACSRGLWHAMHAGMLAPWAWAGRHLISMRDPGCRF